MDFYIAKSGYKDLATLVAFSGDVIDPESGPDKFNETTMNKALHGRDIRKAFDTSEYQVLIVANKYQTGLDQKLLVAMYVDKRIDGITAVQTLSRLNRTCPGKDATFVLDFVNEAETIRAAFLPYYEQAELLAPTDPNIVYTIQTKLDNELIYTEQEATNVAAVYFAYLQNSTKAGQQQLVAALNEPVDRFKKRWTKAEAEGDNEETERLTTFHKNLGTFCRVCDFISQIVSFGDSALESRYILAKHLEPLIRPENIRHPIDLTGVVLTHHKLRRQEKVSISLGNAGDEERLLTPITGAGTHAPNDPEQARLDELVEQLNSVFDDATLTDADRVGLFNHVANKMMENEDIKKQALANSIAQFEQSPTLSTVTLNLIISAIDSYQPMSEKLFRHPAAMERFKAMLAADVHRRLNQQNAAGFDVPT
jgi:type I restriction enzyme R subunit